MTGNLSCQCGEVRIEIGESSPRGRLQCACCDCRQAIAWAQLLGGPNLPSNRPLDLWYFGNDITVTSGKNKLKWFKLREDGKSIRWISECCHTIMVGHHPIYQNKIFVTYGDAVRMADDIPKNMEPAARIQMKDYTKLRLKNLVPFPGGKPIDTTVEDLNLLNEYGKYETLQDFIEAFKNGHVLKMHEVESKFGKTTQEYINEDCDIEILDLKEYNELIL